MQPAPVLQHCQEALVKQHRCQSLCAMLQVKEALMTSALLKLPQTLSRSRKEERVEQILEELVGLCYLADLSQGCLHDIAVVADVDRRATLRSRHVMSGTVHSQCRGAEQKARAC